MSVNHAGINSRVQVIPARGRTSRNAENFDGKKKRIAAYARVSTLEEQQSSSYELQISYYTEYIQKNPNWELYKVFADQGISGTSTKNRAGFLEMIEDAKAGKIDYIITKSISRFARNSLDCIGTIRMLKELPNPCGVYFEKENIDTLDSKSELLLAIIASVSQEESKNISDNTRWSLQKRFSRGEIHCPTTYFLGYDTNEDGEIVINEEEAKVVKRIFKEYLGGKGTPTIAGELKEDGILTARGNAHWTSNAVKKILNNEKYMGHCLAQKTVTLDYLTHKRVVNREHQPQYFIKDCLPQIISADDWNTVQQELKRRWRMLHDPDGKYRMCHSSTATFSNRLFCGECGRPTHRRRLTSQRNGEKYLFTAWQCRAAIQKGPEYNQCKAKYVWEEELEKSFMKLLYEMKGKKEYIKKEVQDLISEYSLNKEEKGRLKELDKKIEAVTNRISEIAGRQTSVHHTVYEATLRNLVYEQETLQIEHEELNKNMQESIYLEKHLKELLKYFDEVKGETDNFREDIFIATVDKVKLYQSQQAEFEFKCGIKRMISAKKSR